MVFSGVHVTLDLYLYMYVLQIFACPFVLFLLTIVFSVILRCRDSDYPFGIFKLFSHISNKSAYFIYNVIHFLLKKSVY